jgi:hypothetical protein
MRVILEFIELTSKWLRKIIGKGEVEKRTIGNGGEHGRQRKEGNGTKRERIESDGI